MRTVLLVDDCSVARRVLARRLTTEGFAVQEAASAADARSADICAFACAIFDLELADEDGASLAESLASSQSSLRIAFFTAGAASSVRDRARAQGPVFDKPDVEAIIAWATQAVQPPPTK